MHAKIKESKRTLPDSCYSCLEAYQLLVGAPAPEVLGTSTEPWGL
jgi:hypothetical protein